MFQNVERIIEEDENEENVSFTGEKIALLFATKGKKSDSEKWWVKVRVGKLAEISRQIYFNVHFNFWLHFHPI